MYSSHFLLLAIPADASIFCTLKRSEGLSKTLFCNTLIFSALVESLLNSYRKYKLMRDIVFPKGNEQEFIQLAKKLGIKGLLFVYENKKDFFKDDFVENSLLVPPPKVKFTKLQGIKTVSEGSRHALECGADIAFNFEKSEFKDKMHYRESGLNQVLCRIALQQKVQIGFSFEAILSSSGQERSVLLGRMMQNLLLCQKFKVPVRLASFASKPENMRSPADVVSFFQDLGLRVKPSLE